MIQTREELEASTAISNVISREVAESLYKSTRNSELKSLLDKGNDKVIISAGLKTELFTQLKIKQSSMAAARSERKSSGGRPRIPDPETPENLTGEALRKYKNRKWQRISRARRGITPNA